MGADVLDMGTLGGDIQYIVWANSDTAKDLKSAGVIPRAGSPVLAAARQARESRPPHFTQDIGG